MIRTVISEMRKGKTLTRALQNLGLRGIPLHGKVLDVAGKKNPSYMRFLDRKNVTQWMVADYDSTYAPDLCFDAGKPWPISDGEYDGILLVNCIYIFEHPDFVFKEAARVLRKGGILLVTFPMIWNEVPEPSDYYRFTAQGATGMAARTGLRQIRIEPVGGRFSSIVEMLSSYLAKVKLYRLSAVAAVLLDHIARRYSNIEKRHPAPCGYILVAGK